MRYAPVLSSDLVVLVVTVHAQNGVGCAKDG